MYIYMYIYIYPHTTVYVTSFYSVCVLNYHMCVPILLHVSSDYYICVLIRLCHTHTHKHKSKRAIHQLCRC